MKTKFVSTVLFLAALAIASSATAAQSPKLSLKMTAEKEVTVVKDGKEAVELKPAEAMKTGDVIQYTITYTNKGNSEAANAVIADPVPKDMVYIPGSAQGADAVFSIDGGRTFHKAPKHDGKDAAPEQYTNIRWTVKKVSPNESGSVRFKARVK